MHNSLTTNGLEQNNYQPSSLVQTWDTVQAELRDKIGSTSYDTWFSTIKIKGVDEKTLLVETPDDFFKNWIIEHYKILLEELLCARAGFSVTLDFSVNSQIVNHVTHTKLTKLEHGFKEVDTSQAKLNDRFTFDNFVIGPSNRFSCAASLAVAESPAKAYNPLFIYGQVGLGKTHLIQAITHKIATLYPKLKVCYMTSEKFTNELIDAIRHRSTAQFRKKYREMDVLLIDDIHFIAGKESTQEEFFHTFNYLHDSRKQIIITSDRPPKEISNLEERLTSRFAWGLITDIQPPNFETRMAILRKKVEAESIDVPDDVIYFIAQQITANIRELEGALIRVVAYALLEEKTVTLDMAKSVLKDLVKETIKTITMEMVQRAVCDFYKIPITELRAKRRSKNIVVPRQVAMYLARRLTHLSLPEIGNSFGGKDHTTVLHACKKIELEQQKDVSIKSALEQLTTHLKHS